MRKEYKHWTKPILTDEVKEAVYKAIYDTFLIEKKEVLSLHRKQHNNIKMCICGMVLVVIFVILGT